jgi:Tfp pilus assembly protein PilF
MHDDGDRERAEALLFDALELQRDGALDEAIAAYRRSIAACPTAEGHTYLGWALAQQGKLEAAIEQCKLAIRLDPELGNPYNDIGVYLMRRGEPDEAIPWLERAKAAPRYAPRHFPYLNLGQIFAAKGMLVRALAEFERAAELAPADTLARRAIDALSRRLH